MSDSVQEVPIAPLSQALREIVTALRRSTDDAARRITAELRGSIPEYGALRDPAVLADVEASVKLNADLWLGALEAGQPTPRDLVAAAARYAQRRVHQGVPLSALLRAYRVGSSSLWAQLLTAVGEAHDLYPELVHKVSPYLLYHFDVVAQAVSQAYIDEQFHGALWRDRLRHELSSVIFSRPDDDDAFLHYTRALGLDPSAAYVALSFALAPHWRLGAEIDPPLLKQLDTWIVQLGRSLEQALPIIRHGQLLVWLPLPHGESLIAHDLSLARAAQALVDGQSDLLAVGIGLPGSGGRGWGLSAEQAVRACRLVAALKPGQSVCRYAEVVLEDLITQAPWAARHFEGLIEFLGKEPNLLETLRVFFELRQHRKAVAGRLGIHPNTLNYRLQRIESLLEVALDDHAVIAQLSAALRLRQLGERPRE
jgi:sugar diacid utilization regulator